MAPDLDQLFRSNFFCSHVQKMPLNMKVHVTGRQPGQIVFKSKLFKQMAEINTFLHRTHFCNVLWFKTNVKSMHTFSVIAFRLIAFYMHLRVYAFHKERVRQYTTSTSTP